MPELTPQNAFRDERRAAMLSLAVSSLLLAIKFGAYWLTASAAIFSDAMESIINVLASAFALYSVILAHSPADRSHPYGHGKIEFLAAGFEGGMILLAAVFIAAQAIHQLVFGPRLHEQAVNVGLLLIALAMLLNGVVGFLLIRSGRKHGSITLAADGKHLLGDAITSAAVIVALGVVKLTGWRQADAIGALLVGGYITWLAIGLLRGVAAGLMDEQDLEDDRRIR